MASAPALYDDEVVQRPGWSTPHPTPYVFADDLRTRTRKELVDLLDELENLALLGANWDGDYSPRIDRGAVDRAKWFVENLQVPWLPLVGATTVGGVRVEWDADEAFLIIDFEPAGEGQVMFRARGRDVDVWRNEQIPGGLEYCYAEVSRVRRGR